ncbi:MAG: translation factor Sua5, partial [Alphaproteobacteria bacterium]|nr:translation factor Sua5 [Alphaproteobacteria bacterium]
MGEQGDQGGDSRTGRARAVTIAHADAAGVARAAAAIREGRLVAMPTETVYGVAADATNAEAVARIYAAKGRPRFNPLIAHVPDLAAALELADLPPAAQALAQAFWPGPLTLVAPRRSGC